MPGSLRGPMQHIWELENVKAHNINLKQAVECDLPIKVLIFQTVITTTNFKILGLGNKFSHYV